jgi:hypothetical protein
MTASFPSSVKTFSAKVDGVTDIMAAHINEPQDEITAIENFLLGGWSLDSVTWTYASATTFTITGNVTAQFPLGTKIKLTQTTVKYFYVISATYSAPNTTVTIFAGSDYSLANAAITSPHYSYAATPQGFPHWFAYAAVLTCDSGAFSNATASGRFCIVGQSALLQIGVVIITNGTAAGVRVSIPFLPVGVSILSGRENQTTGVMLQGLIVSPVYTVSISNYLGANINADARTVYMSGVYSFQSS